MTKVPGRDVPCPGGYTAFVPDPFPPDVPWIPDLVRALSDADRMIGRLAGEGGRLLSRPFVRRGGPVEPDRGHQGAAKRLGVAFTTAQGAVAKLEGLSIITEISRAKRDRVYCARALLGILEEPARLTSMEV